MAYEGVTTPTPAATPAQPAAPVAAPINSDVKGYQGVDSSSAPSGYQGIDTASAASAKGSAFASANPPVTTQGEKAASPWAGVSPNPLPKYEDEGKYLQTQAPVLQVSSKNLDTQSKTISSMQSSLLSKGKDYDAAEKKVSELKDALDFSAKNLQSYKNYNLSDSTMVDSHNKKVDEYNKALKNFKSIASDYKDSSDTYNANVSDYQMQADKYNSDLTNFQSRAKSFGSESPYNVSTPLTFQDRSSFNEHIGKIDASNLPSQPPVAKGLSDQSFGDIFNLPFYQSVWSDTVGKIKDFVIPNPKNSTPQGNLATGINAILGVANLVVSPISSAFGQVDKVPGVSDVTTKPLAKATDLLTQTIQNAVGLTMESLKVSKETQDIINKPLTDIASFAAQIAIGEKIATDVTPAIKAKILDVKTALTKDLITEHTPGKSVYFDSASIKDIWQTGKLLTESEKADVLKLLTDDASRKAAFKNGISVDVPARTLVMLQDKPYWGKIKDYFGIHSDAEIVSDTRHGEPVKGESPSPTVGNDVMNQHIQEALGNKKAIEESSPSLPASAEIHIRGAKAGMVPSLPEEKGISLTPYDTPEIVKMREEQRNIKPTSEIQTPEREQMRKDILDKTYGNGALNKNKRIDIVMGGPGSRKSSMVVNPLAKEHGSIIADSDIIKPQLPEFGKKGEGAGIVHKESSLINSDILNKSLKNGDNIVYPTVGENLDRLKTFINRASSHGYEIHLHHADLDPKIAIPGTIDRWIKGEQGFIDPYYSHTTIGLLPKENYGILKTHESIKTSQQHNTNVEKGKSAEVTRHKGGELERRATEGPKEVDKSAGESASSRVHGDSSVLGGVEKPKVTLTEGGTHAMIEKNGHVAFVQDIKKGQDPLALLDDDQAKKLGVNLSTTKGRQEAVKEPVGEGKKKESKLFSRVQKSLENESPTYQTVSLKEQAEKATEFVTNFPDRAERIVEGKELPPEGILYNTIATAYREYALQNKNMEGATNALIAQSLRSTRYGQEIASLKGQADTNGPLYWIKKALDERMGNAESGKSDIIYQMKRQISKAKGESPVTKSSTKIAETTKAIKSFLTRDQLKIDEAQKIIDSLIC